MYRKLKIGILRETKVPVDNRTPLLPEQADYCQREYGVKIVVKSSGIRCACDDDYRAFGIDVVNDVSDCDVLMGVKEVKIDNLIPNKHYMFFSHIAKMQPYNRDLLDAVITKKITLTDYEYLKENGKRIVAFGYYAGAVGVYNTIRLYGLKTGKFLMEPPKEWYSLPALYGNIRMMLPKLKGVRIAVTGDGRAAHGAMDMLDNSGIHSDGDCSYKQLVTEDLVTNGQSYDRKHFHEKPSEYTSRFAEYISDFDILVSCHYWDERFPKYFTRDLMLKRDNRIKVVGDVTCDIDGSMECTIRPSTHAEPFYDYSPVLGKEVPLFEDSNSISVMAVDTLPNALPVESSRSFGEMVMQRVIPSLLSDGKIIRNATLVDNGTITKQFEYLKDFAHG